MIKMYNYMVFAFFAVVMFSSLQTGYGLKCWFCGSGTGQRSCGDPFNNTESVRHDDCNNAAYNFNNQIKYLCRKVKYRGDNGEVLVTRSCIQEGENELHPCSTQSTSMYAKMEHCSTCSTDLCNSAPALFQITSAMMGPVIVFLTKINIL